MAGAVARGRRVGRALVLVSVGFHLRSALQWYIEHVGETAAPNLPHIKIRTGRLHP